MKDKYNELIIGSGGLAGLSYLGGLEILDTYYPLKNFKYLTGCSAGSLICALLNIGYNVEEMKEIVKNINFPDFFEIKLSNLLSKGGFVDTYNLKKLIKSMFITKKIDQNITFLELYNLTNKILTVNSVNQILAKVEYFNYENTPNMIVIDGVIMSLNIPLICSPIKYNNNIYYDGAILDPYPYNYIQNTKKLGLIVFSEYLEKFILKDDNKYNDSDKINDDFFINNVFNTIRLLYNNYLKLFYNKRRIKNTIYIICNFQYDIEMNKEEKEKLFEKGYIKANLFLKKKIRKLKKDFILKKYFYLLKYLLR